MKSLPTFLLLCTLPLFAGESKRERKASRSGEKSSQTNDNAVGFDRYSIITQRNIFSKNRGKARDEAKASDQPKDKEAPPTPKPEADILLTGIIEKDGQLVAFIENAKSGAIQTVKTGDAIARGKVERITIDSLDYSVEGANSTISIGKNFEGNSVAKLADPVASTSSGSNGGSAEVNSIVERLRKKRQEEMRK